MLILAPPDWVYPLMPLPDEQAEIVSLEEATAVLHSELDTVTEWDTSPMFGVLHVAHLLKAGQEADGRWPERLNARTGEAVGSERTIAPVALFRRLNALLDSTEFERACDYAEAGGYTPSAPAMRSAPEPDTTGQ